MADELKPKQERFCQEYVIDLNGAAAAIRAGYSENTARSIASELLTKPNIKRRVAELKTELAKRLDMTADTVIFDLEILSEQAAEAGQYGPAIRAKELQGKHINMFLDKSGNEQPAREVDWTALLDNLAGDDPALRARLLDRLPIPFSQRARLSG